MHGVKTCEPRRSGLAKAPRVEGRYRDSERYDARGPLRCPNQEDSSPRGPTGRSNLDRMIWEPECHQDLGRAVRNRCKDSNAHLTPERDDLLLELTTVLALCQVGLHESFGDRSRLAIGERGDRFVCGLASDDRTGALNWCAAPSSDLSEHGRTHSSARRSELNRHGRGLHFRPTTRAAGETPVCE